MTVSPKISSSDKDFVHWTVSLEGRSTIMMPAASIWVALRGWHTGGAQWLMGGRRGEWVIECPLTSQHSLQPFHDDSGAEELFVEKAGKGKKFANPPVGLTLIIHARLHLIKYGSDFTGTFCALAIHLTISSRGQVLYSHPDVREVL